jgi:spiro-SPASM protein
MNPNKPSENPLIRMGRIVNKYKSHPEVLAYKAIDAAHIKQHGYHSFPRFMHIEITNACNLDCVMCPRHDMKRKVGFMSMEMFKKIIDQVPKGSEIAISLNLFGESFLHPKLYEMIKYAKQGNVGEVHLNSNITVINEDKIRKILEAGIDVLTLSFEGTNKKTYEFLRIGSNFERVEENIKTVLRVQKEMNAFKTRIHIQMTDMKETNQEIQGFVEKWKPFLEGNNGILIKQYDTWAGQVEDRTVHIENHARTPCPVLNENLTIYWDGGTTICCRDCFGIQTLANVAQDSIKEIWHGEKYQKLREHNDSKQFTKLPLCKNCDDWHKWPTEIIIKKDDKFEQKTVMVGMDGQTREN